MLIDLILDRKDGQEYNAKEFYNAVMDYTDVFQSYIPVAQALDGGSEADVIAELCNYIQNEGYNEDICKYVSSVNWTESDRHIYSLKDFEAGCKFAEVNGAIVEVLECEQKAFGCRLFVKLYGGTMYHFNTAEIDAFTTKERKRRLPAWMKTGTVLRYARNNEERIIEQVGLSRVLLYHNWDMDIRTILFDYYPVGDQPTAASWIIPGLQAKHEGFKCEVLETSGVLVKIRKDYGCNTYYTAWKPASEIMAFN